MSLVRSPESCGAVQPAGERPDASRVDASVVDDAAATTPWFDADQGRVKPVPLTPRVDDTVHRDSRWLPKPDAIDQPDPSNSNTNPGGNAAAGGLFGSSLTLGNLFAWALLAATVLGIVGTVVYAISRAEVTMGPRPGTARADSIRKGLPDQQTLERIKHLPPELRRTDVNLRSECHRLMQLGEYDQAIILMLGHQLLLLDRAGLLRLGRGKTNGQYVREARIGDQRCGGWLRDTTAAFEQSYFGRHSIPQAVFGQLWDQNALLESAIESRERQR